MLPGLGSSARSSSFQFPLLRMNEHSVSTLTPWWRLASDHEACSWCQFWRCFHNNNLQCRFSPKYTCCVLEHLLQYWVHSILISNLLNRYVHVIIGFIKSFSYNMLISLFIINTTRYIYTTFFFKQLGFILNYLICISTCIYIFSRHINMKMWCMPLKEHN